MDIWLAPDNENKQAFIDTLLCMKYSAEEVAALNEKDFTTYFMGSIGSDDYKIDVITIVTMHFHTMMQTNKNRFLK